MPSTFWCEQRQCFTLLTRFIAKVDKKLSIVTVFSVTSNLYYILIQLLHSFEWVKTEANCLLNLLASWNNQAVHFELQTAGLAAWNHLFLVFIVLSAEPNINGVAVCRSGSRWSPKTSQHHSRHSNRLLWIWSEYQYSGGILFSTRSFLVFLINQANRFLEQVVNTKVGFTGMRFFYFTRPLILSVVGTIITYELVLIQFQVLTPKTKENLCRFIDVND